MFTDHNKAKVEGNKPKASVSNQITAALPKPKVSFNNEVLSGRRKSPTNIENTVYPNKKLKVDNDAKVDKLDRIIATSIKITAMAPSSTSTTSTSLDGALNGCVLSVNNSDVLCGRGKGKPHNHVGNINYRDLVAANKVSTPYAICSDKCDFS
jgi:predicted thioredoxin/glutaredoxin